MTKLESYEQVEQASERKYIARQEEEFRVLARRDKLFGQWAAGLLGYGGEAAEKYVLAVIESNFEKPGDDDMLGKVRADLQLGKVVLENINLSAKLNEFHILAGRQVEEEAKK